MTSHILDKDVLIVGYCRTPIGSFNGSLSSVPCVELGARAIRGALDQFKIDTNDVEEVFMGCVLSANLGQAPARQACLKAGLNHEVPCTTVNKVCASGMKAIEMGAMSIMCGLRSVVVCGGMESMSNAPFYLPEYRFGKRMNDGKIIDGMIKDGLWDPYKNIHMGNCAELCAKTYSFSREQQDEYAIESFRRLNQAYNNGYLQNEIVPVSVTSQKGEITIVSVDDNASRKLDSGKIKALKPAFQKDGTVTAGNASSISDGASAVVLVSGAYFKKLLQYRWSDEYITTIRSFNDTAKQPEWFTTAPADAIKKTLEQCRLNISDVDYFEINEAFAVVSLANCKLLNLDLRKVNIFGGAVALGHPIGCSGCRIVVTLCNILKVKNALIGCASICNGGGGASCIILERKHCAQDAGHMKSRF
jgi:acetyl-CoA C-acetyltransferase